MIRALCAAFMLALLAGTIALPFCSATPVMAVGIWVLVVVAWWANADAVHAGWLYHGGSTPVTELMPVLLFAQYVLDAWHTGLGSSLILFGNLAVIASIVRNSPFPSARVLR